MPILFNEARGEKHKFGEVARFFEVPLSNYDLNVVSEFIEKLGAPYRLKEVNLSYQDFIKQVYWAHLFESGRREFIDCDCHIGCCMERV